MHVKDLMVNTKQCLALFAIMRKVHSRQPLTVFVHTSLDCLLGPPKCYNCFRVVDTLSRVPPIDAPLSR